MFLSVQHSILFFTQLLFDGGIPKVSTVKFSKSLKKFQLMVITLNKIPVIHQQKLWCSQKFMYVFIWSALYTVFMNMSLIRAVWWLEESRPVPLEKNVRHHAGCEQTFSRAIWQGAQDVNSQRPHWDQPLAWVKLQEGYVPFTKYISRSASFKKVGLAFVNNLSVRRIIRIRWFHR